MNITNPAPSHIPSLRRLWKDAFADEEAFLDLFFSRGFSPDRCRCTVQDGSVAAALYWFDVSCSGSKMAYLYAVATDPAHRNKGLCRRMMEDTHRYLASRNYAGAILVPQSDALRAMYRKMGYRDCTRIREFSAAPAGSPPDLRRITAREYAALRREYLPENPVIQEGASLDFLSVLAEFYAGDGWLAAAGREGNVLRCPEFLGDPRAAAGLVSALGCKEGHFRTPGEDLPFAQYLPLSAHCPTPNYLGFAFD